MSFKNTSEYVYLSALSDLQDVLLNMIVNEQFTDEQLDLLMPQLQRTTAVLNAKREDLIVNKNNVDRSQSQILKDIRSVVREHMEKNNITYEDVLESIEESERNDK